jgi:hypothetical protein
MMVGANPLPPPPRVGTTIRRWYESWSAQRNQHAPGHDGRCQICDVFNCTFYTQAVAELGREGMAPYVQFLESRVEAEASGDGTSVDAEA